MIRIRTLVAAGAIAAAASVASAQNTFNGFELKPRVFNDFSTTTLVFTGTSSSVTINESNFSDDGMGGNFANRHDALFSTNGGASARTLDLNTGFTVSADINLAVGSNAPRKEAGLRINSPVTGDVLFLVNSDAGEIVAFGGGAPFKLFGSNGGSNGYTPGSTIRLSMTYRPDTGPTPGSIEYVIDRDAGGPGAPESSGQLAFGNLEGGPVNYQVGVYGQFSPNLTATPADFANLGFTNVSGSVVPEPATLSLLAAGAMLLSRGRRR